MLRKEIHMEIVKRSAPNVRGKTRLTSILATVIRPQAALLSGIGSGSICYTGPLLLLLLLTVRGNAANSCHKCIQSIKLGGKALTNLAYHTHINKVCYEIPKLETCKIGNLELWVEENLGKGGIKNGVSCPRGEQWICFTKAGHWDISDSGGVQDMKKEEIVKKMCKVDHSTSD